MKQFKVLLIVLAVVFIFSIKIDAACKDVGENKSEYVKSSYNCETQQLEVYGDNSYGSFGTGSASKNISKDNRVVINKKVNNKKIIDYYINNHSTYVLTDDNMVYAAGNEVADGRSGKSYVFIKVKFYNNDKNKINNLKAYGSGLVTLHFVTSNSNKYYTYIVGRPEISEPDKRSSFNKQDDAFKKYSKQTKNVEAMFNYNYPDTLSNKTQYNEKKSSKLKYEIIADNNNIIIYKLKKNGKKEIEYYYKKNKVFFKTVYVANKYSLYFYKNNKLSKRLVFWTKKNIDIKTIYKNNKRVYHETRKNVYKNNKEFIKTKTKYWYKNNKLNQRKIYKLNKKNKLRLYSKKEYKYRKNGKNYNYITYYKSGKAVSTYKYELNKKGKVVLKKKVKRR